MPEAVRQETTIRDYARLLVRRKWIVLATVVLLPALAVFFALRQESLYQSSAKVHLKQGNLAATLSGIQDTSVYLDPNRVAQTQIELATTPAIAARVLKAAGLENGDPNGLLGSLSITPSPVADILNFTVTDHDPARAELLANEYARQYTLYRRQLDTASLKKALRDLLLRIDQLKAAGQSDYANSLLEKAEQLRTLQAVENSNAVVIRPAEGAIQVQPRPKRYGILGLAFGVMLGIGFAFIRDALDTRVRSAEEITHRLGLPLLARLPEPSRKLQRANRLVMLDEPNGVGAEAFRVLRTNLEFANLERKARTIMITSALEEEGKSTTIANLAVAVARAGQRVALVDLDLRRPYIDRFFKLEGPGLTNVVLGHTTLEKATQRIAIPGTERNGAPIERNGRPRVPLSRADLNSRADQAAASAVAVGGGMQEVIEATGLRTRENALALIDPAILERARQNDAAPQAAPELPPTSIGGFLDVVPSGPIPPDAGEFVGTAGVAQVLDELAARYDLVLIDAPPLLHVGDALTLASKVDGLLLVTRLPAVRRPILKELGRVLEACPGAKLGFALAGAHLEEGYGYGYGYGYYYSQEQSRGNSKPERVT